MCVCVLECVSVREGRGESENVKGKNYLVDFFLEINLEKTNTDLSQIL